MAAGNIKILKFMINFKARVEDKVSTLTNPRFGAIGAIIWSSSF